MPAHVEDRVFNRARVCLAVDACKVASHLEARELGRRHRQLVRNKDVALRLAARLRGAESAHERILRGADAVVHLPQAFPALDGMWAVAAGLGVVC